MSKLMSLLSPLGLVGAGGGSSHRDDDSVDRLNHDITVMMMVIFAIVVSTKQYVGDPIHCWVPGHFTSNYEEYANKICWVSNTYYLPMEAGVPKRTPEKMINYYQWVPMVLLVQALLFYVPCVVWRMLNSNAGIDLNNIIEAAKSLHDADNKDKTIRYMLRQMDRYLGHYKYQHTGCCSNMRTCLAERVGLLFGKRYGNYLAFLYILTKLLYCANSVVQVFLLDAFVHDEFHVYGVGVIKSILTGSENPAARIFPKSTMCDFEVRALGNVHRHTVQCVLPINFFNEKIYLCVWVWVFIIATVNACNLILWILRFVFKVDRIRYVKHYLRSTDKVRIGDDSKNVKRFVLDYLRQDGVLVLRLLKSNANGLAVAELTSELYEHFLENPRIADTRLQRRRDSEKDPINDV